MADDILDEINDDFDDDAMEDMLEDSLEDSSDDTPYVEKKSLKNKIFTKIKGFPKKILGSKKAIIIIAVSFVLLISLIAGLWLFVFKADSEDDQDVQQQMASAEDVNTAAIQEEEIIFEDIVNFAPFERIHLKGTSTMALISMNLSLELTDHRFRKQVYSMEDRIRKIIEGQVEETTWLELRNPEGKIMLKYNLLKRINSIFPKATVRNIYFTFFIMQ